MLVALFILKKSYRVNVNMVIMCVTVTYDKLDIRVVLLDESKEPKSITLEEPMTWRKWHKERIKNRE